MADENGFDDVNGKAEVEKRALENGEVDEDEKGNLNYQFVICDVVKKIELHELWAKCKMLSYQFQFGACITDLLYSLWTTLDRVFWCLVFGVSLTDSLLAEGGKRFLKKTICYIEFSLQVSKGFLFLFCCMFSEYLLQG